MMQCSTPQLSRNISSSDIAPVSRNCCSTSYIQMLSFPSSNSVSQRHKRKENRQWMASWVSHIRTAVFHKITHVSIINSARAGFESLMPSKRPWLAVRSQKRQVNAWIITQKETRENESPRTGNERSGRCEGIKYKGRVTKRGRRKNSSYVRETDRNEETINLRGIDDLGRNKKKWRKKTTVKKNETGRS